MLLDQCKVELVEETADLNQGGRREWGLLLKDVYIVQCSIHTMESVRFSCSQRIYSQKDNGCCLTKDPEDVHQRFLVDICLFGCLQVNHHIAFGSETVHQFPQLRHQLRSKCNSVKDDFSMRFKKLR